jgi:peptidoglycan/xylan/chitin deacetylase (PgdA/CDA1 family)
VGSFTPNAGVFGRVVDGVGITEPVVALTFDDGPSPDVTPRILDALARERVRATFFVLGRHAERYPALVERMVRDGHEVASHGWTHGILTFASPRRIVWELTRTHRLLERLGARRVRLFRAPHGFRNPFVVRTAHRLGYRVVGWSAGVFDTAQPGPT